MAIDFMKHPDPTHKKITETVDYHKAGLDHPKFKDPRTPETPPAPPVPASEPEEFNPTKKAKPKGRTKKAK